MNNEEKTSQMAEVGLYPADPNSDEVNQLARADSTKEKIIAQPPSEVPEKAIFSPVSPITNYDLHPDEAPQVISTSPKFIAADVKDPDANAPQVALEPPEYRENINEPDSPTSGELEGASAPSTQGTEDNDAEKQAPEPKRKVGMICGLPAKLFYTFLAIGILIIIGAAVGGGVGGSIAARNKANGQAASQASQAASSAASVAAASATASRTQSGEPSEPTRPTIVGYYLELYSGSNFTGAMQNISRFGDFHVDFQVPVIDGKNKLPPTTISSFVIPQPTDGTKPEDIPKGDKAVAKSYVWVPRDTGACVRFCEGGQSGGYRCQGETHQPFPSGSGQFDKVIVDFGGAPEESRCSD